MRCDWIRMPKSREPDVRGARRSGHLSSLARRMHRCGLTTIVSNWVCGTEMSTTITVGLHCGCSGTASTDGSTRFYPSFLEFQAPPSFSSSAACGTAFGARYTDTTVRLHMYVAALALSSSEGIAHSCIVLQGWKSHANRKEPSIEFPTSVIID